MEKLTLPSSQLTQTIKDIISSGGSFPLEVTGTSMQPFLVQGRDIVWLRSCEDQDIRKGAILLFERRDKSLVLHRVISLLPDGVIVMNGDGQTWCEKIRFSQVVAVVSAVETNGKQVSCDARRYKLKTSLWMMAKPVRGYIMKIRKIFR